jgi:hypothetical protein
MIVRVNTTPLQNPARLPLRERTITMWFCHFAPFALLPTIAPAP